MGDWRAENLRLRADRDAMDAAKRREAEGQGTVVVRPGTGDCACTAGTVCQHNAACPRRAIQRRPVR